MNSEACCILLLVLMWAMVAICLDLCILRAPGLSNMDASACLYEFFLY